MTTTELDKLRKEIEEVDARLFGALIDRARLARRVGEYKRSQGMGEDQIYQGDRERKLLQDLLERPHDPIPEDWLNRMYHKVFLLCRALQREKELDSASKPGADTSSSRAQISIRTRRELASVFEGTAVAYLGPAGTYSQEAAKRIFSGFDNKDDTPHITAPELRPYENMDAVFDALKANQCQAAVIPIVNNITSTIKDNFRSVLDEGMHVLFGLEMPIHHCLWSKDKDMKRKDVSVVHAHNQALDQCRYWIMKNLGPFPESGPVCFPVASNGAALEIIKNSPAYEPDTEETIRDTHPDHKYRNGNAAIAGPDAGQAYGLHRIASDIQDGTSFTTFWVVVNLNPIDSEKNPVDLGKISPEYPVVKPERCRTHLCCYLPDRPGSLHALTSLFKEKGWNMSHIESFNNSSGKISRQSGRSVTSSAEPEVYKHYFRITVDGIINHQALIKDAAEQGVVVIWLGTNVESRMSADNPNAADVGEIEAVIERELGQKGQP